MESWAFLRPATFPLPGHGVLQHGLMLQVTFGYSVDIWVVYSAIFGSTPLPQMNGRGSKVQTQQINQAYSEPSGFLILPTTRNHAPNVHQAGPTMQTTSGSLADTPGTGTTCGDTISLRMNGPG